MELDTGNVDKMAASDLSRMTLSIEHEVQIKLKEMRIQTVQMYNKLKEERIEERCREVDKMMKERSKRIEREAKKDEGALKNAIKKRIQEAKERKLTLIIKAVENRLRKESLGTELLDECIKRVGEENLGNFLVYALPRDHSFILEYLKGKYKAQPIEDGNSTERVVAEMIRPMPSDGLGGVIFFSRDGTIVCDNSFTTRLDIFRERYLMAIRDILG
ncbi:hypothetical protein PAEPH01_0750 [Pancytospora epiphaga]|nr:hypothetical protein PAEPH01_0750 [Pancytospora epiphaga]